jgi:hypothetical protein
MMMMMMMMVVVVVRRKTVYDEDCDIFGICNAYRGSQAATSPSHPLSLHQIIIRAIKLRIRWAGDVARRGDRTCPYRIFVGRPEERRPLGRPRRRWKDNIKTDVQVVGLGHGLD